MGVRRRGGGLSGVVAREKMGERGLDSAGEVAEGGGQRAPSVGHDRIERERSGGEDLRKRRRKWQGFHEYVRTSSDSLQTI